jgi:hypothetical protein
VDDDIGANDTAPKGPADRRGDWRSLRSNGKQPLPLARESSSAQSPSNSQVPAPSEGTDDPQQFPKITVSGWQAVPKALSEARSAEAFNKQYALWLRTFRWDFWTDGTTTAPVTSDTMLEIVKHWLLPFREAYAVVGLQHGPLTQTIHSHMLIGGIGHGNCAETLLRGSWVRDGHVRVEQFSPSLGGVEYLVKQAEEIEILGTPLLYKPRHLRGHRGRTRRTVKDFIPTVEQGRKPLPWLNAFRFIK